MEGTETRDLLYENLESDEKILIQWYRENPISVYIEIALLKLLDWEVITEEKYRKLQEETAKNADILKKRCGK